MHNFLGPYITPCYGNTCAWGTKKYAWEREHRLEYYPNKTMNTRNIVATFSLVCLVMYVVVAWNMRAPSLCSLSHLDFTTHHCRFLMAPKPQKRELIGGSPRKKKSPAKKSRDKYCSYHNFNSSHTTAECYMLKMKKSGREVGPRTCHVCGSKDHLQQDCPHKADCEDVDPKTGEMCSLRTCFNCGGKGHRPCDCSYRLARWRMGKNAKLFFNALNEGTEFVPIRPGPESLKTNAPTPHMHMPRSSSSVTCTPVTTKGFWKASVTGPTEWTEQEVENVLGLIESEPQICREGTSLVLTFTSEGEVNEAVGHVEGTMDLDGGGYTIARLEPETPSMSTPAVPTRHEDSPAGTAMLERMFQEVDSRIETTVQKHVNVINTNMAGIGKTLQKIEERQEK